MRSSKLIVARQCVNHADSAPTGARLHAQAIGSGARAIALGREIAETGAAASLSSSSMAAARSRAA